MIGGLVAYAFCMCYLSICIYEAMVVRGRFPEKVLAFSVFGVGLVCLLDVLLMQGELVMWPMLELL